MGGKRGTKSGTEKEWGAGVGTGNELLEKTGTYKTDLEVSEKKGKYAYFRAADNCFLERM